MAAAATPTAAATRRPLPLHIRRHTTHMLRTVTNAASLTHPLSTYSAAATKADRGDRGKRERSFLVVVQSQCERSNRRICHPQARPADRTTIRVSTIHRVKNRHPKVDSSQPF